MNLRLRITRLVTITALVWHSHADPWMGRSALRARGPSKGLATVRQTITASALILRHTNETASIPARDIITVARCFRVYFITS